MNVIDALVDHHETLRQLYQDSLANPEVYDDFLRHLVVHHTMEEKYFYDIMERFEAARHDALEAVNEHHIIELIIKDTERFPRDHERFAIKVEGLGEYTGHHLDEEENEIFPLARKVFAEEDLNTLGRLFEEAKNKLLGVALPAVPKKIGGTQPKTAGGASSEKRSAETKGDTDPRASIGAAKGGAFGLGIGGLKE